MSSLLPYSSSLFLLSGSLMMMMLMKMIKAFLVCHSHQHHNQQVSVLLAVPSLLFSTTIDQPEVNIPTYKSPSSSTSSSSGPSSLSSDMARWQPCRVSHGSCLPGGFDIFTKSSHRQLLTIKPSPSPMMESVKVVFFLVTYVVPMVGLSITYSHLGYVLWAAPNIRFVIII